MSYPESAEDIGVQIVETRENDRLLTMLVLENLGNRPLGQGWRLYSSLGLTPLPEETGVRQVLLEGRYGYLEPSAHWTALAPGESCRIGVHNWLFSGMRLTGRQGFHLAALDSNGNQEKLLGSPTEKSPALAPIQLHRPQIRDISPSCDMALLTPEHSYRLNGDLPGGSPAFTNIPAVKALNPAKATISLDGFVVETAHFVEEAAYITHCLEELALKSDEGTPLVLSLDKTLPEEAYRLDNDPARVDISAADGRGILYGWWTLTQLFQVRGGRFELPAVMIVDRPDFEHRGVFIDIARHYHGLAPLKKLITAMSMYKLNRLQLGISNDEGWRLEIASIPELTDIGSRRSFEAFDNQGKRRALYPAWGDNHEETGGYIRRHEFIALLVHGARHKVEVILEFNLPGHAGAILRSLQDSGSYHLIDPEDRSHYQSAQGHEQQPNVMNVCLRDTYRFAADVLKELESCYDEASLPMRRIHLGGDEVPAGAWLHSPVCRASPIWDHRWNMDKAADREAASRALNAHYFAEISRTAHEVVPDIELGFWHEMSVHARKAPTNCYFNAWATETGQGELVTKMLESGRKLVISNASYLYLDMPYALHPDEPGLPWAGYITTRHIHDFDSLGCWDIPASRQGQVMGLQAQLWSETLFTPELMDHHLFPRLLACAERCWNRRPVPASWASFAQAVGTRELNRLHRLGVRFRIPPPGVLISEGKLYANLSFPGLEIRYTTDGSDPDINSPRYDGPLAVAPVETPSVEKALEGTASAAIRLASFHPASARFSRSVLPRPPVLPA